MICISCNQRSAESDNKIIIYAAASLREVLQELSNQWLENGGSPITLVFGSTGDLATQIENGAPADVFMAADTISISRLLHGGLLTPGTFSVFGYGRVAIVNRCGKRNRSNEPDSNSNCETPELENIGSPENRLIAVADPAWAPYGVAALEVIANIGMTDSIRNRIVYAPNVGQALQYAETGNVDMAFVALSLVLGSGYEPYAVVDDSLHSPILHGIASTVKGDRPNVSEFMNFVLSENNSRVRESFGYTDEYKGKN